jgi:hypothetical protein
LRGIQLLLTLDAQQVCKHFLRLQLLHECRDTQCWPWTEPGLVGHLKQNL